MEDYFVEFSMLTGTSPSYTLKPRLSDIPIEILDKICSNLSLQSILNLSSTCKRLNAEIFTSSAVMKKMTLRFASLDILESSLFVRHYQKMDIQTTFNIDYYQKEFVNYGKYIKEITFSCKTNSDFIFQILKACVNLESICFYDCCQKNYKIFDFFSSLNIPKLKSICIHESLWILNEIKYFNIERLDIHAGFLSRFPLHTNWKLNHLHIKRAIEIIANPVDFKLFLGNQSDTLEDLSVITENQELISFIFEELENLHSLVLSGTINFPVTIFNNNFFVMPKLKYLKITTQSPFKLLSRAEWLFDILRHVPALEKLVVDFYEIFSPEAGSIFQTLTFPRLKHIKIKKSNSRLLAFALMPQLETLSLEVIDDDDIPIFSTVKNLIIKKIYVDFLHLGIFFPNIEFLRVEENWDFSYLEVKFALENYTTKLKNIEIARHILPEWMTPESWKIKETIINVV